MNEQQINSPETTPEEMAPMTEQIRYANVLFFGAWGGIILLTITYLLYVSGIIAPHVDMTLVIQNWDKGVNEFLHITNAPHGWGWAALLGTGDYLTFIGLVLLAGLTIICYLFLIVGYKKHKDWIYFSICVLEVLVLTLAASGILGSGGH